ncbi:hypothetical protein PI124_g5091 [Phytophthora idaei]|nr:hypothetical protein PI124_g5091 [Phytophthora idaei]
MRQAADESLYLSKAKFGAVAASNPMACARYYDAVISIFVDLMLNDDQSKQLPRAGMGIFGVTKAFYVSTESQNSTGDVHGHMLIWIDGMPTTTAEYYEMLEMDSFRERIGLYVSSIARSSFPLNLASCPRCRLPGLTALPFQMKALLEDMKGVQQRFVVFVPRNLVPPTLLRWRSTGRPIFWPCPAIA